MESIMKKLIRAFSKSILVCCCYFCLCLLSQQIAYAGSPVPKAAKAPSSLKKAFSFLFIDNNKNKKFDAGEPLVVMAADDYRELFQRDAPLERMLRGQINGTEFIVLTQDDFYAMDTNRDRRLNTTDISPYHTYDLHMSMNMPQDKQVNNISHPSIFLYTTKNPDVLNYIITSKHRPIVPIQRDAVASKIILDALHIKDFNALPRVANKYTLSEHQKKIIIEKILALKDNLPLYKIYFAHVSGTVENDFIDTKAKMVNLGDLKKIVLQHANDNAYFGSGLMMKIHSSPHYLDWMGL